MWGFLEGFLSNSKFAFLVLLLFGYGVYKKLFRPRNTPPGPYCMPIIGYLPFLGKYPHETFIKLSKKYGAIFSLYIGNRYTIVVNDWPSVKEALSKPEFLGRPNDSPFDFDNDGGQNVVELSGQPWQEQRRFILHILRDLGFGKNRMENYMKDEIADLIRALEKLNGKPVNLDDMLLSSVSNNISGFMFGRRLDYEDPKRKNLDKVIRKASQVIAQLSLHTFLPWIKPIIQVFAAGVYKDALPMKQGFFRFLKEEIREHRETLDENNIRDFIDGFLLEIEKRKVDIGTSFTENMLLGNLRGLFGAGSETVRTSLGWSFLIMAAFPDIQKRVQDEIDDVIGRERTPSWEDHSKCPYTQATLQELSRWRTVIPLNLLRYSNKKTKLGKYNIPRGTIVLVNIWAVHHDPEYWENPHKFDPERFLEEDKHTLIKTECLIPFSMGKRACPGETMANVEIFLYFTTILQRFNVLLEDGARANFDGNLGISLQPKPQKLRLVLRQ